MECGLGGLVAWFLLSSVPPYCISQETLFIVRPANMSEWCSRTAEKHREKQRR